MDAQDPVEAASHSLNSSSFQCLTHDWSSLSNFKDKLSCE